MGFHLILLLSTPGFPGGVLYVVNAGNSCASRSAIGLARRWKGRRRQPRRRVSRATATAPGKSGRGRSEVLEEAQRIDVVAHQQVLGLLVMVEHH
ncbi:hypothetical protein OH117_19500, partial [Pseudomonas aeruginosa]